jgi:hypothetical protein
MSSDYIIKPLKGIQPTNTISTVTADEIIANSIIIENVAISGTGFDGGALSNVTIDSSIIGENIPGPGYFTTLQTGNESFGYDVVFYGANTGERLTWNAEEGTLFIVGDLDVTEGCGRFQNIKICGNNISSLDGDINLRPFGNNDVNIFSSVFIRANTGSFDSILYDENGYVSFQSNNYVSMVSNKSYGNFAMNTGLELSTINGDITLETDSSTTPRNVISIQNGFYNGNTPGTLITTSVPHNYKVGDTIVFENTNSTPPIIENKTVLNTTNPTTFFVSGNVTTNGTTGTATKLPSNSILLNASKSVNIPTQIPLTFGPDCNTITGENGTGGLFINTCGNIRFNIPSQYKMLIPSNVDLQFGNGNGSDTTKINYDNTFFNIVSPSIKQTGDLTLNGSTFLANVDTMKLKDPILTLANDTSPTSTDLRDRGLEYFYPTTNTAGELVQSLGWFGYKSNSERFTFIPNATNNNEVISGSAGNFEMNTLYTKDIVFNSGGNLAMTCGTILGLSQINGCGGELKINGTENITATASNQIKLSSGTGVLLNSNVPLVFGSYSNTIQNDTSGNLVLFSDKKIVLDSNVLIKGESQTVLSTITNIQDPIFSIGGVIGPIIDDDKDRGIEFKWNSGTTTKTGFFGFDDSTGRFTFIPDGTNVDEVYSGAVGDIQVNDIYANDSFQNNVNLIGNISMVDGVISGNTLTLQTNIGDISISPTVGSSVLVPFDTKIAFGNTENSIQSNNSGEVLLTSSSSTTITAVSDISLNSNTAVVVQQGELFIGDKLSNTSISNVSFGSLQITADHSLYLDTQQFFLPQDNTIYWGNSTNGSSITSDGTAGNLILASSNTTTFDTPLTNVLGDINISGNTSIFGGISAEFIDVDNYPYIYPLGSYQVLYISSVINGTASGTALVTTTKPHNLKSGDTIRIKATNSVPSVDGTYTIVSSQTPDSFIINWSGEPLTTNSTTGRVRSVLVEDPQKDVGLQINWHTGATNNTDAFKTGFVGVKRNTERLTYYREGTNNDDVFTGTLGDIEVNKVFTSNISGFTLDGGLIAGTSLISGSDFKIDGGAINNTVIGNEIPQTAHFTNITSGNLVTNQGFLTGNLHYSFERINVNTLTDSNVVSNTCIASYINISGESIDVTSVLPDGLFDGQLKIIVFSNVGVNSTFTFTFASGKVMFPNPFNQTSSATSIQFKRKGQSISLLWDNIGQFWLPIGGNGGYVN